VVTYELGSVTPYLSAYSMSDSLDLLQPKVAYKQVIVVQRGLKMNEGKTGAQTSHGAMAWLTRGPDSRIVEVDGGRELRVTLDDETYAWLMDSYRKVFVWVSTEAELLAIHEKALAAGLRSALIVDNGLTQFHGVKTPTVVAIGPNADDRIDPVTGHLPLFRKT
jgi:PTH2 family peptidyl-tRNA hydrolase